MAAFIPNRRDPAVTETALAKVRDDKERESGDGFDGTWVAHPDLVPVALEVFDGVLGDRPNQKERLREEVVGRRPRSCSTSRCPAAPSPRPASGPTCGSPWPTSTRGCAAIGAAAIDNLMEDAATAEISPLAAVAVADPGGACWTTARPFTPERYATIRDEELTGWAVRRGGWPRRGLLDRLVLTTTSPSS